MDHGVLLSLEIDFRDRTDSTNYSVFCEDMKD